MKQLVLCGIGITALFLMSCSGTNFTSGNDTATDAGVTTNSLDTTSSTVLTSELCDGTTTDFTTVQTALLYQLQSLNDQYSSEAMVTSGTYTNRNIEMCRQIVNAQQIVASATSFTQEFNSILSYTCNRMLGSSSDYSQQYGDQQNTYDQQGGQHRPPPQGEQGQRPPPRHNRQSQGEFDNFDSQRF